MSQRYMLDTNVLSHIMQGRDAALLARLTQLPVGQVVISSVTLAELEYGLHRKGQPARLGNALRLGVWAVEGVEAKIGPSEDSFCRICSAIAVAMGQKDGKKWTAAVALQPTTFCRPGS